MKKWRCKVCGYIHEGPTPPDICPVCGVGPEEFEPVANEAAAVASTKAGTEKIEVLSQDNTDKKTVDRALFKVSYGLYIITSKNEGRLNGQVANTIFQITSQPNRLALGVNKSNMTHEFIQKSGVLAVSVLGQNGHDLVRRFGYRSGRDADKFENLDYTVLPETGTAVMNEALAFYECRVDWSRTSDVGTHTLFVADVISGRTLRDKEPMTYAYFRQTK